jgi:capsular polysaccharide biosynthesis protein
MWKFRWPGLIVAWVVSIVGVIVVFKIPDQYEASARIYVDTQSILKPLMAGLTVQPNVEQQVGMLSRTLISRPNVEKLIRMADLDLKSDSKIEQEALVDRLTKEIQIRNTGRDNLYSLAFRDSDQEKSKRVIQSLVSIFVESSLGASRKDTDSAKTFLNEQIKQYETKLEEAEARVKEFRMRNIDNQAADGKDAPSRVAEIGKLLEQAKLELREAENAREAAKAQLAADKGQSSTGLATSSLLQESSIAVATPEIDARFGRSEAQPRRSDAALHGPAPRRPDHAPPDQGPGRTEEEGSCRAAQDRAGHGDPGCHRSRVQPGWPGVGPHAGHLRSPGRGPEGAGLRIRGSVRRRPRIAEDIAADRGRGGPAQSRLRRHQEELRRPGLAAAVGRDVRRARRGLRRGRLPLIDPPRVSPKPVAPNRLLLLPAALGAALAAGLVIAFLGSQLRPVFTDANELRLKTGLPLLGVISISMSDVERRQERLGLIRFFGASAGLVGIFVIGLIAMAILSRQAG